jgi:hypothetical protein
VRLKKSESVKTHSTNIINKKGKIMNAEKEYEKNRSLAMFQKKRIEVSNNYYRCMLLMTFILVILNMILSFSFGYAHKPNTLDGLIFGVTLATFDLIAAILGFLFLRSQGFAKLLSIYVLVGVVSAPIFAAFAMFEYGTWAQENIGLERQRSIVQSLEKAFEATGFQTKTKESLQQENFKLTEMEKKAGGAGISEGYRKLADFLGYDHDVVQTTLRLFWASTLVLSALLFGGLLGDSYCPKSLDHYARHVVGIRTAEAKAKSLIDEESGGGHLPPAGGTPIGITSNAEQMMMSTKNYKDSEDFDVVTKTEYEKLKSWVMNGRVKPSQRHIRSAAKCQQSTANKYLKLLEKEGVIKRKGVGFILASQ